MVQREAIARGHDLEREVMEALGILDGVTVWRNDVKRIKTAFGGYQWTGLGDPGKGEPGAPDMMCEVRTPSGLVACVWLECKSGEFARLNPAQKKWHTAATSTGRHAYVVRSAAHAVEIVESFKRGVVYV